MKKRDKEISIRVSEEELEKMREMADYLEIPISTFARNLILTAYEDAVFLKKIGVLKGAKKLTEFQKKFKEISKELQNSLKAPNYGTS